MVLPLSDIKVVDLTRILSGPFCTMLLGDMGADVVKIESPDEGDPIRKQGTIVAGISTYFASFNRNKRSLVVNLRTAAGKVVLEELLSKADVLVENFRPGVLDDMGFSVAHLEDINPRLITASINGYGSSGPYAQRPAFDFIAQAMSGFMSLNGAAEDMAMRSGVPVSDLVAGIYAAFGIVNALRARDVTGKGQRVEAAMVDSIMSLFAWYASDFLAAGKPVQRSGNDHPITAPYGMFTASDGAIAVAPSTEVVLDRFLKEIDLQTLKADPRFVTNALRMANRPALNAIINEKTALDTQSNWVRRLNDAGVPCGVVQGLEEVFSDPQTLHRQMVIPVEHPGHGTVRMLGFPVKLSDTPCEVRMPAPDHGQHNAEIVSDWQLKSPGLIPSENLKTRA
ncbi:CaiB/BaiF CoA transferase family protein [Rhizobium rhizogenes]|uniref:CaiB/BaiF CoA transferase family protein n=1 Tax=Rhizobium rhizogenes TaxID=359 RepID=UPI0015744C73|nr:CoA transferase [Rhizobium rhizogenes]NTH21835.1 CoA transferase [Rhizobium rhizogenes]NTH34978.1 CoA transferase [Rhizobium rhizogenes]